MTLPNIVPVPPPGLTTQPSNGVHQGHATSPGLPSVAVNPNPFAGIPVRDYVLDAVSALLLVVSLFMVWHYQGSTTNVVRASSNIAVLLLTILSLLSLGLTYLWRAGAFGPTWNYRKMQDLRMAANIPYMVLFLVSLVMILLEGSSSGLAGAMGQAAAFGLAGALLAAQPRKAELTERSEDAGRDRRWIFILFGVVALALLLGFVQFIKMLVSLDGSGDWFLVGSISTGLLSLYLMVELVRRIHAKNESARLLAVGLGLAGTFMVLVSLGNPWQASSTIYGDEFVFSAFMWLPFGAIAAAPSIARQMLPMDSKAKWLRTIHLALNLTLVIAAVSLLTTVGNLIEIRSFAQGAMMAQLVLTLLFSVVLGVGALVVRQSFTADPTQAYTLTSAFAGIIFVLFLILVIMASANDFSTGWMAGLLLLITFVIPAALLGLLWAPSSTRAGYSALKGKAQMKRGFSFDGTSGHAVPQPVEGTVEAGIEQLLAEASSAGTAPLRLRELALNHPQTRDAIIANPVTYAELRDWLVQLRNNLPAPEPSAEEAIEPLLVEASDPATSGVRLQELAGAHPELHEAILANPAAYAGLCNWIVGRQQMQAAVEKADEEQTPEVEEQAVEPFAPVAHSDAATEALVSEEAEHVAEEITAAAPVENADEKRTPLAEEPVSVSSALVSETSAYETTPEPIAVLVSHEAVSAVEIPEEDTAEKRVAPEVESAAYPGVDDSFTVLRAAAPVAATIGPLPAEAGDPATSGVRLQELAGAYPHLHEAILENPAAYDGLREWIISQRQQQSVAVDPLLAEAGDPRSPATRLQELAGTYPHLHEAILANPAAYDGLRQWILAQAPAAQQGVSAGYGDPSVAEAANPATDPARLQELAGAYPELHAVIAANPSTYPQLLQWLAQVNSPGVAEALNRR